MHAHSLLTNRVLIPIVTGLNILLYLLSVPWVNVLWIKKDLDHRDWCYNYTESYRWLLSNTPVDKVLFKYSIGCGYYGINGW